MIATAACLALATAGPPQAHAAAPIPAPAAIPQSVSDLTERERALIRAFALSGGPRPNPTNAWADDAAAAALGRSLFFDPGLSSDGSIACATCHDPEQGWADGRPTSEGLAPLERNSPTIVNAAYSDWQFWDGRADSLWSQALAPIEDPAEMGSSRLAAIHRVRQHPFLRAQYEAAFGPLPDLSDPLRFPLDARPAPIRPEDPFAGPSEAELLDPAVAAWEAMAAADRATANGVFARLGKAIAAFERGLVSGPGRFDQLARGLASGDAAALAALDARELHGWRLFVGRAGCVSCHFGPTFSDGQFHNVGLGRRGDRPASEARTEGIRRVRVDPFNGRGATSDAPGWEANTKLLYVAPSEHVDGAYKTPSLRDVTRTAPYGHDGRFASLDDVVRFYSELPDEPAFGHREETLQPLELSAVEVEALVAFLQTLTGPPVGLDPRPAPLVSSAGPPEANLLGVLDG